MLCPHCARTISEQDRYLMSSTPEHPGLIGEYRRWLDGEREPLTVIAVIGSSVLLALLIVGLAQIVSRL